MKRILLLVFVVFAGTSALVAQNTCTDQLRIAQQSFDDGILDDIPDQLAACMRNGFTKEEKANAYKLLIQTYLFSDQPEKADQEMLKFLNEFPSYSLAINDPTEFVNLYNTYRTDPIFKIEVLLGATLSIPSNIQYYGIHDLNASPEEYYKGAGFRGEVNYMNTLKGDFDYAAGISFAYSSIGYSHPPFDYTFIETTFSRMAVGVPLSVRYHQNYWGIDFFAKVGIEPLYILNYSGDFTRTGDYIDDQLDKLPFKDYHKKMDLSPFLGIGVNINLGRDYLLVNAGFKFGTINHLRDEGILKDFEIEPQFYFVDDDMLLNHGSLSISYLRPIYKPKKIR